MMKVIFCFFITCSIGYCTKYYCVQNETINLKENEIVFFHSVAYPLYDLRLWCTIKFSLSQPNDNRNVVLAFNIIDHVKDPFIFYINHTFDFELFLYDSLQSIYTVNGYAANLDTTNGCPLETIGSPFVISDETEIIYIRSTYFENESRNKSCLWKFKSTVQYGFKVVIQIFNVSRTTKFRIRNSTEIFIDNDLVVINHPYYNSDNYIELFLSLGDPDFVPELEFQAYISIFKKDFQYTDAHCTLNISPENYNWFSDTIHGYQNNAKCSYSFDLAPNRELIGSVVEISIENNADILKYTIDYRNTTLLTYNFQIFIIRAFETTKNILFEFISDGSLQFSGFNILFSTFHCKCSFAKIILCTPDKGWTLMDGTSFYCSDLQCNFTFAPCPGYALQIYAQSETHVENDTFKFYSNNETVLDINVYNLPALEFTIFFNPKNLNRLEFQSSMKTTSRMFGMKWSVIEPFTYRKYILSEENPSYNIFIFSEDVKEVMIFEVKDGTTHNGFMIYITEIERIQIYNNETLTINLSSENCFPNQNVYTCKLENYKKFAILPPLDSHIYVFGHVRLLKNVKGCVFKDNTFVATNDIEQITGIANSEGECVITLLIKSETENGDYYLISHLWTTATKENVKMYIGNDTTQLLFNFNSHTMIKWKNIGLFSRLYTIHIPKNSALYMIITYYAPLPNEKSIFEFPYSSIISTPNFKTLIIDTSYDNFLYFAAEGNICLKFTVFYYNSVNEEELYFQPENNNLIYVENNGETFIFKNQQISLNYWRSSYSNENSGTIFFIEPFICENEDD